MSKKILFSNKGREKLRKGTQALSDVVSLTMGPRGQAVAIDRGYDTIVLTDGVNTARQVELKDKAENLGVRILRESAVKTVDTVGDATSVTILLGHTIFSEYVKMVSAGINPMALRADLEKAKDLVVKELRRISQPLRSIEQMVQVATISAEDEELGEIIAKTLDKIGEDGVLTVEESHGTETTVDHQEGLEFNNGWMVPQLVTDPNRMEATVEDAHILITDLEISDANHLVPLFTQLQNAGIKNLVFIAYDIQASALASLVFNKVNGVANINLIKNPIIGPSDKLFLEDIAILTGGRFISKDIYSDITKVTLDDLGQANRVTSTSKATQIIGGKGDKKNIKERVLSLKVQLENHEGTPMEYEKLKERVAKLSRGVAVLNVAGHTEIEMKERRERALDAVSATKVAMREGIVPGGEVAFLVARKVLEDNLDNFSYRLLYNALEQPFKKLLENAGLDGGEALAEWKRTKDIFHGIDVTTGKMVDMMKKGIVDPTLAPVTALENAVSVAVQLGISGAVMVPEEEEADKNGR